jgi:hypothetical protein
VFALEQTEFPALRRDDRPLDRRRVFFSAGADRALGKIVVDDCLNVQMKKAKDSPDHGVAFLKSFACRNPTSAMQLTDIFTPAFFALEYRADFWIASGVPLSRTFKTLPTSSSAHWYFTGRPRGKGWGLISSMYFS